MSTPQVVTSPQNPRLKLLRKLATRRGRERERAFAVEGEDLVHAGIRAGWTPRFVVCNADSPPEGVWNGVGDDAGTVLLVPGPLLAAAAALAHPPRVVAVFDLPEDVTFEGAVPTGARAEARVYLDGVRDPGNLGTIARTANAFGVRHIGLGPYTVDPWGPKATRASMGAVFDVQFANAASAGDFAPPGSLVVALDAAGEAQLHEVDLGPSPVLCIGSERSGVSDDLRERADLVVSIPQRDDVDSLNAAAAASIVLYEWQRQRLTGAGAAASPRSGG